MEMSLLDSNTEAAAEFSHVHHSKDKESQYNILFGQRETLSMKDL